MTTWNTLAAEAGLPLVRLPLSEARRRKLRVAMEEIPNFWEIVALEVRQRGQWARERRFPTFDQVLQRATRDRLLEGNYRDNGAQAPRDDRRARAFAALKALAVRGADLVDVDGTRWSLADYGLDSGGETRWYRDMETEKLEAVVKAARELTREEATAMLERSPLGRATP